MHSLPPGFPNSKTGTAAPVIYNPGRLTPQPKSLEDRNNLASQIVINKPQLQIQKGLHTETNQEIDTLPLDYYLTMTHSQPRKVSSNSWFIQQTHHAQSGLNLSGLAPLVSLIGPVMLSSRTQRDRRGGAVISSPPISEEWCANQTDHAYALDSLGTSCHWIADEQEGHIWGVLVHVEGAGTGEGVWDARACHLSARDDGTSSDASPPWTQLAGHTPRPSQKPNVLPAQRNVKPHTFTQDLETGPKREIQGPVTNQDSNLPPPQATPINQLQKIWRRQLSGPPPPPSPQPDTGRLLSRHVSDLHAAGGAGQACAREPPNWGPSRRLTLGALRARESCARTKLTNKSCSCAKCGEFGSDHAVIGLGGGGKGLYRQEGGVLAGLGG